MKYFAIFHYDSCNKIYLYIMMTLYYVLQISVGRMEFDVNHAKGVLDKSFPSIKVPLHKDSTSSWLLHKCREVVWGESPVNYEFFMADGSGSVTSLTLNTLMD